MMLEVIRGFLCNRWNVLLLAGALVPLVLQADVIFSNLSGTTPSTYLAAIGSENLPPNGTRLAVAFTPTGNFLMTDAEVLVEAGAPTAYFDLSLYSDSAGVPHSDLGDVGSDLSAPSTFGLVTADSFPAIDLTEGTEYWLVLQPDDEFSVINWGLGGSSNVPLAEITPTDGVWSAAGPENLQFEIDGTPITTTPEPAMLPLISVGVLGLLIAARRAAKQRA
jgi:hypothetical protein